jgi:hypothetical protein
MLNRRQVVGGLVSLAVLGPRGWWATAAAPPRKPTRVTLQGDLSKAVFVALLQDVFTISADHGRIPIQLIQVKDGPSSAVAEQFTLLFRGPRHLGCAEGTYVVTHHSAGSTLLFLQPVGYDHGHIYYDAVFNLLL